jgi:glycosyltransferase involved in cell wall biosynthesis
MINKEPLVSIIIPTYNRAEKLRKAIESVLNQTYSNKQIIIVDDGSTDDTAGLVQRYKNVQYIFQEHNGQGRARNTGLQNSNGVYIASLDSDDTWNPDFLEKTIAILEQEQLDFAFSNWTQINNRTGQRLDSFSRYKFLEGYINKSALTWTVLDHAQLRALYIEYCPSPSSSVVIRRSSIKSGWNEEMNIADDWGLLLEAVVLKQCKAAFTNDRLWVKQTDGTNICDGRKTIEVIEQLWINDVNRLMLLLKNYLSKDELKVLKYIYAYNSCRYSANLLASGNIVKSFRLFKQAIKIDPFSIPLILLTIIRRRLLRTVYRYFPSKKERVSFIAIAE